MPSPPDGGAREGGPPDARLDYATPGSERESWWRGVDGGVVILGLLAGGVLFLVVLGAYACLSGGRASRRVDAFIGVMVGGSIGYGIVSPVMVFGHLLIDRASRGLFGSNPTARQRWLPTTGVPVLLLICGGLGLSLIHGYGLTGGIRFLSFLLLIYTPSALLYGVFWRFACDRRGDVSTAK